VLEMRMRGGPVVALRRALVPCRTRAATTAGVVCVSNPVVYLAGMEEGCLGVRPPW
jgi:hypothetical protein